LTSALIPYALVSLAGVVAVARLAQGLSFGLFLPVEGAALVVALFARQLITLVDNVKLNRRLLIWGGLNRWRRWAGGRPA
jgi:hypothetical protein